MKQCIECDRHLFGPDAECPFCGAAQPTTAASTSTVAAVTFALGIGLTACGPTVVMEDGTGVDGSSTSPTPMTTTEMTTVVSTTTSTTSSSTTDGTTAASDDADEVGDGCGGFYAGCPPDGGPINFECDLFAQDCPEGEKCMPWSNDGAPSWNATRCSPIADNPDGLDDPCVVEGSAYSGIDTCDAGLICFYVDDETNAGQCIAICGGDESNPTCPEGDACLIANDGAVVFCLDMCDPLMQDCDPGSGCYPPLSFEGDVLTCWPTMDPGTYPEPCDHFADCDPGSFCVASELLPSCEQDWCCTDYCDVTVPDTCSGAGEGVVCRTWWETGTPPPGYEDLGACLLP